MSATQLPVPTSIQPAPAQMTSERLLQATHELLGERGGGAVSVAEICERAGANVAMVKYCFGSKDGLMLALTMRVTDSFRADFDRLAARELPWQEKLRRHLREVVRNYMRFPYLTRLLGDQFRDADAQASRALSESFVAPMAAFHRALLDEAQRAGALGRVIDPMLFFFSVVGMCEFVFTARPWLTHGFDVDLDEALVERYADHVCELVLAGLAAE